MYWGQRNRKFFFFCRYFVKYKIPTDEIKNKQAGPFSMIKLIILHCCLVLFLYVCGTLFWEVEYATKFSRQSLLYFVPVVAAITTTTKKWMHRDCDG